MIYSGTLQEHAIMDVNINHTRLVREVIKLRERLKLAQDRTASTERQLARQRLRTKKISIASKHQIQLTEKKVKGIEKQHAEQLQNIASQLLLVEGNLRKEQKEILEQSKDKELIISKQRDKIYSLRLANEKLNGTLSTLQRQIQIYQNSPGINDRNNSDSVFCSDDETDSAYDAKSPLPSSASSVTSEDFRVLPKETPRRRKSGLDFIQSSSNGLRDQYQYFSHYSHGDLTLDSEEDQRTPARAVSTSDLTQSLDEVLFNKGSAPDLTKDIREHLDSDEHENVINNKTEPQKNGKLYVSSFINRSHSVGNSSDCNNHASRKLSLLSVRNCKSLPTRANWDEPEAEDYMEERKDSVSELDRERFRQKLNYLNMANHKNVMKPRDIKMKDRWRSRSLPHNVNVALVNGALGTQPILRQYHPPVSI